MTDIDYDATIAMFDTQRTCDGCEMCCIAVRVWEGWQETDGRRTRTLKTTFDKPAGVRCPHLSGEPGKSCSIYDKRPTCCRAFVCLWRGSDTLLPEWMQPNKCGFVVALDGHLGEHPTVITIHPGPTHPNSWQAMKYVRVFKELARRFNAIVVVGQGTLARHIFSPKGNEFTKEDHPHLFNGTMIGLPQDEFLAHRLSPTEIVELLWGDIETARKRYEARLAEAQ